MRKRLLKNAIAMVMAIALIMGEGGSVLAAVSDNHAVAEIAEESTEEASSEEMGEEEVLPTEETEETDEPSTAAGEEESTEEENPEEDSPVEDGTGETETSSETMLEEVDKENMPFPGLPDGYRLTAAQKADKIELSAYVGEITELEEAVDYVENEIMVEAATREEAEEYARAFGGTLIDYFSNVALIMLEDKPGTGEVSVVKAVAASAQADTLLPAAWPNYYRYIQTAKEDPFLWESSQSYQWYHNAIGSKQAWAAGKTGKGVKVAVLDTGILIGHQDVTAQLSTGFSGGSIEQSGNVTGGSTNDGNDVHGHGTHVAGIIAAKSNSFGGRGIAYEAELLSVKVMRDNGSGTTAMIVKGLDYAIEKKVDIINMSLGGYAYQVFEADRVKKAYEAGIAVFCAASNDSAQSSAYPAAYEGAIAIAALDKNNHKADFSNYGSWVRYSAPGVDIYSTITATTTTITITDAYGRMSGTSQATPVAAGIAAVLWNEVEGEGKTRVDNLLALMDRSCEKVTGSGLGKGVVSLTKALGLDGVTTVPSKPVFSEKTGKVFITDTETEQTVTISAGAESIIYYSIDGKNVTYKNGVLSSNAKLYDSSTPIKLNEVCNAGGKVTIKAIAVNRNNQLASGAVSATYTLKPKYATEIIIASATGSKEVAKGKSLKLTAALTPTYVTDKSLEWSVEGNPAGITVKAGTVTVKNTAAAGFYTIKATAKSTGGNYTGASNTFQIQVTEGNNPITVIKINNSKAVSKVNVGQNATSIVTVTKKDKTAGMADELTWISSNPETAAVEAAGNTLTVRGVKAGKAKITGMAKDGSGKMVSYTVTVVQPVTGITISPALGNQQVAAGGSVNMTARVEPADATNKALIWTSNHPLVKVSSTGKVSVGAKAFGTVSITATARDGSGQSHTYVLMVTSGKVTKITVDQKTVNIFRVSNKFKAPTSTVVRVTASGDNPTAWTATSSNSELVKVKSINNTGVEVEATGKATGTATITVQSTDGTNKKAAFKVKVSNPATALHIAPQQGRTDRLVYQKTMKLSGVLETSLGAPSAEGKKLKWESLNSNASVDQKGNVKALTYTTYEEAVRQSWKNAVIRVSTTDGSNLSATYEIRLCGETKETALKKLYESGETVIRMALDSANNRYSDEVLVGYDEKKYPERPYLSKERDYSVNKKGLSVYYDRNSSLLWLRANERGTYKLTISYLDGSTAKKSYTVIVE